VLAFGACVKKCPKTGASVECIKPTYMTTQQNYYKDCEFSPSDIYSLVPGPLYFRYDTEVFAGKFCIPSAEALADPKLVAMVGPFKAEFDKYVGDDNPAMAYLADIIAV